MLIPVLLQLAALLRKPKLAIWTLLSLISCLPAYATLQILAAENVYGDVAQQLGGEHVTVNSILHNPNQDPHLFSADIGVAKAAATADIVIYNGAGYDAWMDKLLAIAGKPQRQVIQIAQLLHATKAANPHFWYNPYYMQTYAEALCRLLQQQDPASHTYYQQRLQQFTIANQALIQTIQQLKAKWHGLAVTATEPVFGYMAEQLGLIILNQDFQWSLMKDISPTPGQVKRMEDSLMQRQVKVLIYNQQVVTPLTHQLIDLAKQNHLAILGVNESQPKHLSYTAWMQQTLQQLAKLLDT